MVNSEYFRQQAAACLRLAAAIGDQKISAALVAMADDFSVKADEIDPNLRSKHRRCDRGWKRRSRQR
jgi:hypothetical protein